SARRDAARVRGGRRLPRGNRQGRLRGILHASHGTLHRRRSARHRRQYGQFRDPRRAPRDAVELLLGGTRHLSAGVRGALGDQHVHRRQRRAGDGRDPARNGPAVMPPQALAAVATLLAFLPHGNRIELQLDRGSAELIGITPSTFHFRRVLNGPLHPSAEAEHEPVVLTTEDTGDAVRLRSRLIEVTLEKQGVKVGVRRLDGTPLMMDLSEARSEAGGVVWERQALAGAAFYGLGPGTDAGFDLRGKSVRAEVPFLVSTAGYGEYHPGPGTYHFDFTDEKHYRIQGPEIDYYFYYGPTPKEIFEEHNLQGNYPEPWSVASERFGSWATLKASLLRIVHGSMSAAIAPMFN